MPFSDVILLNHEYIIGLELEAIGGLTWIAGNL